MGSEKMGRRRGWMVLLIALALGVSLIVGGEVYTQVVDKRLTWDAPKATYTGPSKDWTQEELQKFLEKPWTEEELKKMGRPPRYILGKKENLKPRAEGDRLTPEQLYQNGKNIWMPLMWQYGIGISSREFYKIWIEEGKWKDPKHVLLDLRQESEFDHAHIPGAKRLDTGLDYWQLPSVAPDSNATYYLLCKSGTPQDGGIRGAFVAKHMLDMGYKGPILNITDGFRGWIENGFPVINRHGLFVLVPGSFQMAEKDAPDYVKKITPFTSPMIMDLAQKLGIKDW